MEREVSKAKRAIIVSRETSRIATTKRKEIYI